ncbi:MAG TPA: DUF2071 domain-containing protein, partial [Pyrinomonadaceae bacterium]|nr:DUF2071 domain-containing protein [Pyrinomonadaceae bacterium]
PGVWFFSLDAANSPAVWGARIFYHLPYFSATMSLKQEGNTINYSSIRKDKKTYAHFFASESKGFSVDLNSERFQNLPRAALDVSWTVAEPLPLSKPGSIEFFLTERYCLYAYYHDRLYQSRIFHEPWKLHGASSDSCHSTMVESLGIAQPSASSLLHYAESIAVEIWRLKRVSEV